MFRKSPGGDGQVRQSEPQPEAEAHAALASGQVLGLACVCMTRLLRFSCF